MPPALPCVPLTAAQVDLATAHFGLALRLADAASRSSPWLAEEFESSAVYGLVQAAASFDPACGLTFGCYVKLAIRSDIVDAARKSRPRGYRGKGHARRPCMVPLGIGHDVPGRHEACESDECEAFERMIRPLPRRNRDLLRLIYRGGLNQSEAAAQIGCVRSTACRLHRESMEFLAQR